MDSDNNSEKTFLDSLSKENKITQFDEELNHKRKERNTFLLFKKVVFFIAIAFSILFLCRGLDATLTSLEHIQNLQKAQIHAPEKQDKEALLSTKEAPKNETIKPSPASYKMDPMLSAGSMLTLVAFTLGVGLTLLLTLIKFAFTSERKDEAQNSSDITISGPLSELIKNLINTINNKLKGG